MGAILAGEVLYVKMLETRLCKLQSQEAVLQLPHKLVGSKDRAWRSPAEGVVKKAARAFLLSNRLDAME